MDQIEGSSVLSRGDGWLSAWVGDELVMMSAESGTCISMSQTGGRTWELMETPCTLNSLCDQLAEEYDASADAIRQDVVIFLERLRSEGGVVVGTQSAR